MVVARFESALAPAVVVESEIWRSTRMRCLVRKCDENNAKAEVLHKDQKLFITNNLPQQLINSPLKNEGIWSKRTTNPFQHRFMFRMLCC